MSLFLLCTTAHIFKQERRGAMGPNRLGVVERQAFDPTPVHRKRAVGRAHRKRYGNTQGALHIPGLSAHIVGLTNESKRGATLLRRRGSQGSGPEPSDGSWGGQTGQSYSPTAGAGQNTDGGGQMSPGTLPASSDEATGFTTNQPWGGQTSDSPEASATTSSNRQKTQPTDTGLEPTQTHAATTEGEPTQTQAATTDDEPTQTQAAATDDEPSQTDTWDTPTQTSDTGAEATQTSDGSDDTCDDDGDDTGDDGDCSDEDGENGGATSTAISDDPNGVATSILVGTSDDGSPTATASSSGAASTSTGSITGTTYDGEATYYLQNGNAGACGTVAQDSDKVVALYTSVYGSGGNCGRQIQITSQSGTTIVATVRDECPSCSDDAHIDLSVGAFTALGTEAEGEISVTWGFIS